MKGLTMELHACQRKTQGEKSNRSYLNRPGMTTLTTLPVGINISAQKKIIRKLVVRILERLIREGNRVRSAVAAVVLREALFSPLFLPGSGERQFFVRRSSPSWRVFARAKERCHG